MIENDFSQELAMAQLGLFDKWQLGRIASRAGELRDNLSHTPDNRDQTEITTEGDTRHMQFTHKPSFTDVWITNITFGELLKAERLWLVNGQVIGRAVFDPEQPRPSLRTELAKFTRHRQDATQRLAPFEIRRTLRRQKRIQNHSIPGPITDPVR